MPPALPMMIKTAHSADPGSHCGMPPAMDSQSHPLTLTHLEQSGHTIHVKHLSHVRALLRVLERLLLLIMGGTDGIEVYVSVPLIYRWRSGTDCTLSSFYENRVHACAWTGCCGKTFSAFSFSVSAISLAKFIKLAISSAAASFFTCD